MSHIYNESKAWAIYQHIQDYARVFHRVYEVIKGFLLVIAFLVKDKAIPHIIDRRMVGDYVMA